jgi:membrane protein required for beta-lactamase induction
MFLLLLPVVYMIGYCVGEERMRREYQASMDALQDANTIPNQDVEHGDDNE